MLSARTTDATVNQVTSQLFVKYPDAQELAKAQLSDVEKLIKQVNFYKTKAKNLIEMARILVQKFDAQVPNQIQQLIDLPGVGRKTANVVLGNAFAVSSGIVVDTHVKRLTQRLGLTNQHNPIKIEQELMAIVPPSERVQFAHLLIAHGRAVCKAQRPICQECNLSSLCCRFIKNQCIL